MSTYIWGIKIYMADHMSPLAENTTYGLYNVKSNLTGTASAGQKVVAVADGTKFTAGTRVRIVDTENEEECIIDSINANNITMVSNLAHEYTVAREAKVYADSEFRWIQNAVSGISDWCDSMLVENGISKIIRDAEDALEVGGGVAQSGGLTITVKNTSKFWNTLFSTLDVSLIGRKACLLYTSPSPRDS